MTKARSTLAFTILLAAMGSASAVDYRSVDVPAAILYDSPSQKAKKLYLIKAETPVEVVVRLDVWSKIRDAEGTLAWIESRSLSEKRMLVVIANSAEIRQADRDDAPVVAELGKWVAIEFDGAASAGWAKVHHRDGAKGFIKATQVWGL